MNTEPSWTLGVLIGYPIAALLLLAAIVTIVLLFRSASTDRDPYSSGDSLLFAWLGVAAVVVASVIITIASYPWVPEYHQWRPISGTVEQVDSRLLTSGESLSERFVVRIDGMAYGVDDTRASLLKPGDQVSLSCRREWQYAAEDGYVCRWGA